MTVKADSLLRGQHYHAVDVLEGRVGQIVGQGLMNEFTKTEQPSSNEPVTLDFIGDLAEEERKYEAFMQFISEFEEGDKNISKPETGQKSLKFNPFIQFSNQLFPGSCYVDLGDHDNHLETEQSPHEEVRINGSPSKVAIGLSLTLDFVPILGQLKAAREVWTGMDPITEQKTNRLLSAAMLIPGGKVATMTGKWLTKTKPVIAAMQWMGETKIGMYSNKAYGFFNKNKDQIIMHVSNGLVNATTSLAVAYTTNDAHPWRAGVMGFVSGLAFAKPASSYAEHIKNNIAASLTANLSYQFVDIYHGRQKCIDFYGLGMSSIAGAAGSAIVYGAPAISTGVISFGPQAAVNSIGVAIHEKYKNN
jgi:hypothetical protein